MTAVLRPAAESACPKAPGIGVRGLAPSAGTSVPVLGGWTPAKAKSWAAPTNSAAASSAGRPVNVSYKLAPAAPAYTSSRPSVKPVSEPDRLLTPAPMVTWAAGDVCGPAARVLMRPMAPWEATARKWVQLGAVNSSTDSPSTTSMMTLSCRALSFVAACTADVRASAPKKGNAAWDSNNTVPSSIPKAGFAPGRFV